jgi:RNA polymerase I-specific transcription initiation factor RRN7
VIPNTDTPPDGENPSEEQGESEESSSSESSDAEENEDPEIVALLRENSASGSSDDDGGIVDALKLSGTSPRQARKKSLQNRYDSPASNVAVLALACWMMRIPVMCADFRKSGIYPPNFLLAFDD